MMEKRTMTLLSSLLFINSVAKRKRKRKTKNLQASDSV